MRRGVAYSAALHVAVILLAAFGLPHLMKEPAVIDTPIPVDVVTIAEKTSPPKSEVKPQQAQPQKPLPLPPAPPLPQPAKPEPQKAEAPTPPEPPKPEPAKPEPSKPEPQQVAAVPQPPEPEPAPKQQNKPEPKPEPKPTPTAAPIVPEPPQAKPKPPPQNTLQSILRSVETMKPKSQPDQAEKVIKQLAQAPASSPPSLDNKMTISEIDAVRRQIERCWNVPAGAKDAKNLIIEIHVTMNPDGTVRQASIVDQARMGSDTFFRAAAESAYRAIYLCQPLKLPPEKYSVWQDMTLRFDPSQILG
ncbi:MAG TPA: energy transducer TonB [Alphaproteobacteria bacterium]|nr:energy transducer TonB [Alphaproteobacteria bacterium]